ncbi:MAG: glutamyl-tRNA reductase, partial [Anaerolineales bacterium]
MMNEDRPQFTIDPPSLVVVGVNHKAAPVAVRERAAFRSSELPPALTRLSETLSEVVLLSTCNRTEIYAMGEAPAAAAKRFLSQERAISPTELDAFFYIHREATAVRHLFTVAAGLDSMLLGEPQIQGQVKDALQAAMDAGTTGPSLSRLFQTGLRVGKAARTNTGICRQHLSIGQAAADLAQTFFNGRGVRPKDVLIIGAGEMAMHVARGLAVNGLGPVIVANRTYARAQVLAAELRGSAIHFDKVPDKLTTADMVICASAAPHIVLNREQVAQSLPRRNGRPLFLIDIAVPRDIEPSTGNLPGVQLYNIDDLQGVCDRAMEIVLDETVTFVRWLETRAAIPTIQALRQHAEMLRQAELEKTLRQLGELSPAQQQAVEAFSRSLVNKLLHEPIIRLKRMA